jgi:hypothetical protein
VSLTFSDPGNTSTLQGFRRGVWVLVVVFLVIASGATALTLSEGPRLRAVVIDEASSLRTSGATLALRSDRAVTAVTKDMVTVSPSADFSVESSDTVVRIVFSKPLRAVTRYQVTLTGVSPRGLGAVSNWEASFETPAEELLYLRAAGNLDELVRLRLDGQPPEVLYQAQGIQRFTRVGVVYAVLRSADGDTFIELVDPVSGGIDRLAETPGLPVTHMASSAWGTSLIVTVDYSAGGRTVRDALAVLDTVGLREPEIVEGIDGQPLGVLKMAVSPVSGSIVVWLKDQSLILFDPLTGIILPLGNATELWGLDSLGDRVVAVDSLGTLARNLATGEEIRVPAGSLDGFPVSHEFTVMAPDGTTYQRVRVPGFNDGIPFYLVTADTGEGVHRRIFGNVQTPESIGGLGLSPNGQYLVIASNQNPHPLGFAGLLPDVARQETVLVIWDTEANAMYATEPGYSFTW